MYILLIDDDILFAKSVIDGLSHSYIIHHAKNGDEAENMVIKRTYDIIILDITLPDVDGVDFCQMLRKIGVTTPILILTGTQKDSVQIVRALNIGADDYLTKPFLFDELEARINALVRRQSGDYKANMISFNCISLDTRNHIAKVNNNVIQLRPKEYLILKYLMLNAGRVVSRSQILEHIWEENEEPETNCVDVHILQLRKKLGPDAKKLLKTIYGFGYKLET